MSKRAVHLTVGMKDGCKTSTKHLGAYMGLAYQDFQSMPEDRKCTKCLNSKLFAFVHRVAQQNA